MSPRLRPSLHCANQMNAATTSLPSRFTYSFNRLTLSIAGDCTCRHSIKFFIGSRINLVEDIASNTKIKRIRRMFDANEIQFCNCDICQNLKTYSYKESCGNALKTSHANNHTDTNRDNLYLHRSMNFPADVH